MSEGKYDISLTDTELDVLVMLTSLGMMAFDVPSGPGYVLKRRLEDKNKYIITEQDFINVMKKIEKARP